MPIFAQTPFYVHAKFYEPSLGETLGAPRRLSVRALLKCVQCVRVCAAIEVCGFRSTTDTTKAFSDLNSLLAQQLGWGNTDLFCFLSTPPTLPLNFPNSDTVLPGEPSCVESEFCGKICGVCGPCLEQWARPSCLKPCWGGEVGTVVSGYWPGAAVG